ncbi:hypothetical protein GCM10007366_19840 [Mammaliicoccus vitulinus]|nr:hypothetical protein GCM10007366_19840 [Mammaliicoccus vitulinus]
MRERIQARTILPGKHALYKIKNIKITQSESEYNGLGGLF